jgi:hypothetical protein
MLRRAVSWMSVYTRLVQHRPYILLPRFQGKVVLVDVEIDVATAAPHPFDKTLRIQALTLDSRQRRGRAPFAQRADSSLSIARPSGWIPACTATVSLSSPATLGSSPRLLRPISLRHGTCRECGYTLAYAGRRRIMDRGPRHRSRLPFV